MKSIVLAAVISSLFPGPETPLAPQPVVAGAPGVAPSVAGSPYGFFAAWSERGGFRGMRLSPDGGILDPEPIVLPSETPGSGVSVEWNGSDYVVRQRVDYSRDHPTQTWFVSPEGAVRGPLVAPHVRNARGESLEVEWASQGTSTFYAVGSDGTRRPLASLKTPNQPFVQAAVPSGDEWGVLVTQAWQVRWYRIDRNGGVSGYVFREESILTNIDNVAARENEIAFTWDSQSSGGRETGYTVLDARTGAVRYGETLVRYPSQPNWFLAPVIAFDGADVLVAWSEAEERSGGRTTVRLKSGDSTRTVATYAARQTVVSGISLASGARNLLTWEVRGAASSCCARTFMRTFDGVDELEPERPAEPLFRVPAQQVRPRAVAGAAGLFAAWREEAPEARLVGRFSPARGSAPEPFAISEATTEYTAHAVAASDDTFVVAWSEVDFEFGPYGSLFPSVLRILVRRYDSAGTALDAAPVLAMTHDLESARRGATPVAVIADGSSFVVAWDGADKHLYALRVPSRGAVSSAPVLLSLTDTPLSGPVLVRLGGRIVIVHGSLKRIEALRLSDDLNVEARQTLWDITRFQATLDGDAPFDRNTFDAASNGDELLIAWSERDTPSGPTHCLYTRRFTAGFLPIEPARSNVCVPVVTVGYLPPSVAWDGTSWWIGASGNVDEQPLNVWRLGADGGPEPLVTIASRETEPAGASLVATPSGLLALYARLSDSTPRVFFRPLLTSRRSRSARH